jgi:hypothetical protein
MCTRGESTIAAFGCIALLFEPTWGDLLRELDWLCAEGLTD